MISIKFGGWTWKNIHSYKLLWDEHMFGKVLTHSHTIGIYWDIGNWQQTVCHGVVQEWGIQFWWENGVELIGIGAPHDWTSQNIISLLVGWSKGGHPPRKHPSWCTVYLCGNDVCSGFHMMAYSIVFHKMLGRMCYCINYQWNYWKHMAIRPFGPYIPKLQSAGSPAGEGSLPSCPQRSWHRHYFWARVHRAQGLNTWMEHFRILAAVGCVDRAWLLKIGIRISLKGPRFLQPICNLPFL